MTDSTPEEKLLNLIKKDHSKAKLKKDLKIFTKINIILIGFITVLLIVFLADVFILKDKLPGVPVDTPSNAPKIEPVANDAEEDMATENENKDINLDASTEKISIEEIKANLNLLGIIIGNNNQAIIEDKSLKKTFFLYKGDNLGELEVYDIRDSRVILDYKGEKIELNM